MMSCRPSLKLEALFALCFVQGVGLSMISTCGNIVL
jgi:hypothetical protein